MTAPHIRRMDMRPFANVRVTGALTEDAHIVPTTGAQPHWLLMLHFAPAAGLPYFACVDFGVEPASRVAVEAELPSLRRGALVSVGGRALAPCRDHGHDSLRVVDASALVIVPDPIVTQEAP